MKLAAIDLGEKLNPALAVSTNMLTKVIKILPGLIDWIQKWGRADSYDFCLNSSVLGIDGTVKLITQIIEDFEQKEQ